MKRRFWFAAVLTLGMVLLGPPASQAQRGGARTSRPVFGPSRGSSANVPPAHARIIPPASFSPAGSRNGEGVFPGIGLGLGYGFYGTNQDLGIRAAIDPATQLRLALAERLLRNNRSVFGGGEYYLLDGGGAYVIPTEENEPRQTPQQPQVIVLQQAPAQQSGIQAAPEPQAAAPVPDKGEFTLVLRSGKSIQAVAFTHMNERIVYIGTDGSRHTIATDELDSGATVRVNEERGTPLQLPL